MPHLSFHPARLIEAKRDGKALSEGDLRAFIDGIQKGVIPDYQTTAWLMATYFNGMTSDETVALTRAMLESGERYSFSQLKGPKVDKHSTGGVGDKVSLLLAPLAAACGLIVPMMAGRGLGHTGGTIDKLESIPGYTPLLSQTQAEAILKDKDIGCVIMGQSETIAPADRKLYSLRDVTATIDCVPLIVGSIISKKLAEGAEALVLDVKVGSGAFMKTKKDARTLAQALIRVGKTLKLPIRALLTDMSQPLGCTAGNALEVEECVRILRNEKNPDGCSSDLKELTLQLCAQMLVVGKLCRTLAEGRKLALSRIEDLSAWKRFLAMIKAQGGDTAVLEDPTLLPKAPHRVTITSKRRGYLTAMDTEAIGKLIVDMGGGRRMTTDRIDPSVGIVFHKKLGSKISLGESLAEIHAARPEDAVLAQQRFIDALEIRPTRKPVPRLVIETIA